VKTKAINFLSRSFFLGLSAILMACSSLMTTAQLSPEAIIVRNNSGVNYASASLSALSVNAGAPRAFGELAPIPNRVEQVYGRSNRAPPLPNEIEFRLQTISRTFQLNNLAEEAAALSSAYVVVFDLQPGGEIRLMLERK
jgi:hypothetical protein